METSRALSDSGTSATPRLSFSACTTRSSAARSRASQVEAAVQPSSISTASGAAPPDVAMEGFHCGPAAARITSAAKSSRSKVSHHGVREGVSSFGAISKSIRVGGKSTRRGRGGMSRSSHHSTGRLSRPSSTSGCAKTSGSPAIMRTSPFLFSPLPSGERSDCEAIRVRGFRQLRGYEPPHPNPLPHGERERAEFVALSSCRSSHLARMPAVNAGIAGPHAHARMQRQQQFARRPIGAMDGEAPAQPVGFRADLRAVTLDTLCRNRRARFPRGRR